MGDLTAGGDAAAGGGLVEQRDYPELCERILDSERAYEGSFLKVDRVDIELPNGRRKTHEVLRHSGAVGIVALAEDACGAAQMLVVRQYRTALERVTIEIPAGKLECGEDPEACAVRELSEETGYVAGEMRRLGSIAPAAGYADELLHLFLAADLEPGEAHPDDDEFVVAEWVDVDALVDSVLDGRIEDSKTVVAALLVDAIRRRM